MNNTIVINQDRANGTILLECQTIEQAEAIANDLYERFYEDNLDDYGVSKLDSIHVCCKYVSVLVACPADFDFVATHVQNMLG